MDPEDKNQEEVFRLKAVIKALEIENKFLKDLLNRAIDTIKNVRTQRGIKVYRVDR